VVWYRMGEAHWSGGPMTPHKPRFEFGLGSLFGLTLSAAAILWAVVYARWEYFIVAGILCSPALMLGGAIWWINRQVRR
jgi:hypothetical protein